MRLIFAPFRTILDLLRFSLRHPFESNFSTEVRCWGLWYQQSRRFRDRRRSRSERKKRSKMGPQRRQFRPLILQDRYLHLAALSSIVPKTPIRIRSGSESFFYPARNAQRGHRFEEGEQTNAQRHFVAANERGNYEHLPCGQGLRRRTSTLSINPARTRERERELEIVSLLWTRRFSGNAATTGSN
jgi:hypothetical protein